MSEKQNAHRNEKLGYPQPPLAQVDPRTYASKGQPVLVRGWSSDVRRGRLLRFDTDSRAIELETENETLTMPFSEIKALQTTVSVSWSPVMTPAERPEPDTPLASEDREFVVEFRDEDSLKGTTHGFRENEFGLYLFPAAGKNRLGFVFIPREGIRSYKIGPLMGETLVETGAALTEDVQRALETQKKNREKPLGELLESDGLVTAAELEEALSRQHHVPNRRIGEILVEAGLVTEEQISRALESQRNDRKKQLGELLVDEGLISRTDLTGALARKLGIPRINLRKFYIDPEVAQIVSENVVRDTSTLPVFQYENRLVVATDDPLDWSRLEKIEFASGRMVDPVIAERHDIRRAIDLLYASWAADEALEEDLSAAEADDEDRDVQVSAIAENLVVSMVNRMILNAYHDGASDIHIESGGARRKSRVRLRKDGIMMSFLEFRPRIRREIVSRIKVMAGLDVTERRKPQDGRIDLRRFSKTELELRVATIPVVGGEEDVVMRLLSAAEPLPIRDLGLSPHNLQRLGDALAHPHGLLLVCGPTGSGKTTTLHAMLGNLRSDERKIWTAEDPVEIVQPGLRQVHVNAQAGLTFAAALRAFLRADPDVIMIGEMRDAETANAAVEAALTGHMVLSTLHTNSAPETVSRMLNLGINPFNFADSLVGILAQRLVRKLCPKCRKPVDNPDALVEDLLEEYQRENVDPDAGDTVEEWRRTLVQDGKFKLFEAVGCDTCSDTGYAGRFAAHELLINSRELGRLIRHEATAAEIRKAAQREGMRTLRQDGIEKVLRGVTDIKEVHRTTA
ncbi:MAG: ATPase, T2SS/T4P/T4SS family [Gammaproteobacteria bacterium]|nr:ATPase, T2SS/T4P/T4SS family [Gammaproteobacteria bacterium]